MSIRLGNEIPKVTPTAIKQGVLFRLFDSRCTKYLNRVPLNITGPYTPFRFKIPRKSKKVDYKNFERAHSIRVDDTGSRFATKNTCLRMKVKLPGKCPWFDCSNFTLNIYVDYGEAISPVYYPTAPASPAYPQWPLNTSYSGTFTTTPYDFGWSDRGSSGSG
jgi:hypothetical protein